MKKKGAALLVVLMLMAAGAKAYDFRVSLKSGDFVFFTITDASRGEVKVVPPNEGGPNYYEGNKAPSGIVAIPSEVEYNGKVYKVTAIGNRAFSGCTHIQMVSFPEGLQEIGDYAFYGCSGLSERVTIGRNVRRIGNAAFYGCASLTEVSFRAERCTTMGGSMSTTVFGNCNRLRRVIIEEGVKEIPDYAFCGVDAMKDSITFPQSLEYIGNYAFAYCSSLSGGITLPDGVERVGEGAFHQCHAIRNLTIGSNVASIGGRAFYHCVSLRKIAVKAFTPPEVSLTTFAELPKGAKFSVPCVSKDLYDSSAYWKNHAPFVSVEPCSFSVDVTMGDSGAGIVMGSGQYSYADTVCLIAICNAGYAFDGWSDGNRENPRKMTVKKNIQIEALTHPASLTVVYDTIYEVDTVYTDGVEVVYDTLLLNDIALGIGEVPEVNYDSDRKRIVWKVSKREQVLSVSIYNQVGECVYTGKGRKGKVSMRRRGTGSYILRLETSQRIINCRFFVATRNDGFLFDEEEDI